MKTLREQYMSDVLSRTADGSNKADSYIRALGYLGPILAAKSRAFDAFSDIYAIHDVAIIRRLYKYIVEQQRLGIAGIFDNEFKPSYWRSRFYSAALNDYINFLLQRQYENKLWAIYDAPHMQPKAMAEQFNAVELDAAEIDQEDADVVELSGTDVLQMVKTRRNQRFFRSMILRDYSTTCCITGLTVPEVLRASHIIPWAEDEKNRMNPTNGLCLSATYDAAFDRHLISFDETYRLVLAPALKEQYTDEAFKRYFLAFEGAQMALPQRFKPSQIFLEKHREEMA